jgi:2-keto-4-pentenoate hydratase/2-oxohepta-3-ene-1,7-dioic acid hydratase in catechol pathway
MKLVTFTRSNGGRRLGLIDGEQVVDLQAAAGEADPAWRYFADMNSFILSGFASRDAAAALLASAPAGARHAVADVTLLAPILPSTILCSGSNYHAHNAEKANTPISGNEPEFFLKTSDCVIGPNEPIVYDERVSKKIDCETELAIVIGKAGRFIPVEDALDHVFGYTICNDVTARDRQVRRSPEGVTWYELGRGKAFDTSAPLGPVIVTADEIPDPQALQLSTRINGELRQSSSTGDMIWSCADLVHFFSFNFTLKPGMVILTGTPAGTAWSADKELGGNWTPAPGLVAATRYCLPGDQVESEIDAIGVLKNPIAAY